MIIELTELFTLNLSRAELKLIHRGLNDAIRLIRTQSIEDSRVEEYNNILQCISKSLLDK